MKESPGKQPLLTLGQEELPQDFGPQSQGDGREQRLQGVGGRVSGSHVKQAGESSGISYLPYHLGQGAPPSFIIPSSKMGIMPLHT